MGLHGQSLGQYEVSESCTVVIKEFTALNFRFATLKLSNDALAEQGPKNSQRGFFSGPSSP
jgi:hypothetical protein